MDEIELQDSTDISFGKSDNEIRVLAQYKKHTPIKSFNVRKQTLQNVLEYVQNGV